MDVDYLITFANVIKMKSISQAARKLFISQPGVSLRIKRLENQIGLPLIEYRNKNIYPTEAGKQLFHFAETVYHNQKLLSHNLEQLRQELTGSVVIASSITCGEFVLPSFLSAFKRQYKSIGIKVVISNSWKVIDYLNEGVYEVGFGSFVPHSANNEVKSFKIASDELVVIVARGHTLAQQEEVELEELVGESLILREDPWETQHSPADLLLKAGFDVSQFSDKLVIGTNMGVIKAVQERAGIAFISDMAVKQSEAHGLIKALRIKGLELKRDFFCIYRNVEITSRITSEFISFVRDMAGSASYH